MYEYETIPVRYLDSWLEKERYGGRVIDLRDPEDYERSHLAGAENWPYRELMEHPEVLDGEEELLFYCQRGSESMLACNRYWKQGRTVFNLGGGWRFYRGKYGVAAQNR